MSDLKAYDLRSNQGYGWATIVLKDNKPGAGQIFINSDYGDWCFYWSCMGSPLREFLITANSSYLMGKLEGRAEWFDGKATKQAVIEYILTQRIEGSLKKEQAREIFDFMEEEADLMNQDAYYRSVENGSEALMQLYYEQALNLRFDFTPGLRTFFTEIWPQFLEIIQAEIVTKKEAA